MSREIEADLMMQKLLELLSSSNRENYPLGARLPTVPHVRSVTGLTTVSHGFTFYASMFEPLNRSRETFITKLSKSTETGERSQRSLKKPKSYKDESDGCIGTWIEVMKLHFETL